MLADEYALQILALHKPWDGNGENILDLDMPTTTDTSGTHLVRMPSYAVCLLTWYDANGTSTAIPMHTRQIMDHQENYYVLKKIAKQMSDSHRKDVRLALGLPPINEHNRRIHHNESSDDESDSDGEDDDGTENIEDLHVANDPAHPIHGTPRKMDRLLRDMLDNMDIGKASYVHPHPHR
jgi:hypothetical protein